MTLSDWRAPLSLGAFLRVLAWSLGLWSYGWVQTDTIQYWELASHGLAGYGAREGQLYSWSLMRPPGYPAILALFRFIHDSPAAVALLQAGLGIAAVGLTYALGKRLGGEAVATVAAWWVALSPIQIIDSSVLLTEVPFSVFLLTAVLLLSPIVEGDIPEDRRWAGAGLALAVATLIRPIALYLPVAVLGVLAASRSRARFLRPGSILLIAFALPVGAWMARNHGVTGVATLSTIQGFNLAYYRAAGAVAAEEGITIDQARARIATRVQAESDPGMNPAELSRIQSRVGIREIVDHPVGYVRAATKGLVLTLAGPARSHTRERLQLTPVQFLERPLVVASAGSAILMAIAAGFGAFAWIRERRWKALLILGIPLGYLLIVGSGGESWARFRVPLEPLMSIFGAVGGVWIHRWMNQWRPARATS